MDELLTRLKRTFLGELDERVHALNRDLLALEESSGDAERRPLLNSLFRSAHSLKGAASSVEIGPIEAACHHLEDAFMAAIDQRLVLESDATDLLLAVVDAIQIVGSSLRQDQKIDPGPLAKLLPLISGMAVRVAKSDAPAPPSPLNGADTASIPDKPPDPPVLEARPAPVTTTPLEPVIPVAVSSLPLERDLPLVRVAAEKLDTLLARSGELMVASRRTSLREADIAELRHRVRRWRDTKPGTGRGGNSHDRPSGRGIGDRSDSSGEFLRRLDHDLERLGAVLAADRAMLAQVVGAIDGEIRRARMQPLSEACLGLSRTVRDLSRASGKTVQLVVTGGEIELDRSILDGLKDPLLHLVRNALDHGIETPERRRAAGKPARSEIRLAASLHGNSVEIVVSDDGAGLDLTAIRDQARRRGMVDADDAQIARCIFLPGFSTSATVTSLSGRGVGLDEVRAKVERMRGFVGVTSVPGEGTRFALRVPLTLTTLRALLVRVGTEMFALDSASIIDLRRVSRDALRSVGGRDMLPVEGGLVPLVPLASLLGLEAVKEQETREAGAKLSVVLVGGAGSDAAFVVDELIDEQEMMVRSLGARLRHVRHVAGATVLANGRIALILNSAELVATALDLGAMNSLMLPVTASPVQVRRRLLLVEDSITTRTLECSILESAGYEVIAVSDGIDAWSILQQESIDLIVSDIDMPRMDGIALTETIRASPRFQGLPIVLVTARESDDEKARGLAVGADAYLVKSGFDQSVLLETIGQFL